MLKKMMLLSHLILWMLPMSAQSQTMKADSVYEFRFVSQKSIFFVPYKDNLSELQRLSLFVDQYREEIMSGKLPLRVDGYCGMFSGDTSNLAVAKLRANRVKSELILHNGMREECFITCNHAEGGDCVTVRVVFPTILVEENNDLPVQVTESNQLEAVEPVVERKDSVAPVSEEPIVAENTHVNVQNNDLEISEKESVAEPVDSVVVASSTNEQTANELINEEMEQPTGFDYKFALRANLLRWLTFTPDLGIEWRISRQWGFLVNGSWTSWSWDSKNRRYALWEVAPEVRYYIGKEKKGYVGAMYKMGEFNYKFSKIGKLGDLIGGGITGGYQMKLNSAFALDFNLGVGGVRANYDEYEVIDGVKKRQGSEKKNYWGVNHLGISLLWNFK